MNIEAGFQVLELLEKVDSFRRVRYEVGSIAFSRLRHSVRGVILSLRDTQDEWVELQLLRLQRQLADWLTTPCSFQGKASNDVIACLSEVDRLCARWENRVQDQVRTALATVKSMTQSDTALQLVTSRMIRELKSKGRDFRIICHRTARHHFHDCLQEDERTLLTNEHFLHTVRDYRDSKPFEVLLKVGPLRADGWSSSPSAIVNAPRFNELVQLVWHPTPDDLRFGLDPVLGAMSETGQHESLSGGVLEFPGAIKWSLEVRSCGEDVGDETLGEMSDVDDLGLLSLAEADALQSPRAAVLVILAGQRGILYPLGASIIVFDPAASDAARIRQCNVSDEVGNKMFLVWPRVDDGTVSEQGSSYGKFQEIWRSKLNAELDRDSAGFAHRLRNAGLNLAHPETAARYWAKSPSSVIHAPKRKRHFDMLMRVLGIPQSDGTSRPWVEGWREICRSRGEAIQAGMQEHARLVDRCISVLRAGGERLPMADAACTEFAINLNGEAGLHGAVHFLRIDGVEEGYKTPEGELRQIQDLDDTIRWRV
jgi:hypothetical protein